jgi:hypothetical protein
MSGRRLGAHSVVTSCALQLCPCFGTTTSPCSIFGFRLGVRSVRYPSLRRRCVGPRLAFVEAGAGYQTRFPIHARAGGEARRVGGRRTNNDRRTSSRGEGFILMRSMCWRTHLQSLSWAKQTHTRINIKTAHRAANDAKAHVNVKHDHIAMSGSCSNESKENNINTNFSKSKENRPEQGHRHSQAPEKRSDASSLHQLPAGPRTVR